MMNLFERLLWAKENLSPYHSQYTIVYEDDLNDACAIMYPDPNWMASALYGGILPPVEAYQKLESIDGKITNGHILHDHVIPAMSEEEAIEYLIQKDIPPRIWRGDLRNRQKFKICKRDQIPLNRNYRNAWSLIA
ncbi:hypothetical protein [Curvivirga sp.]|uniref:hypothetical protein n=1 Tax=Curvivirga sp. TaxID=2856848 RepID=UPI003B5ABBE7